jgi:hypothetical protein
MTIEKIRSERTRQHTPDAGSGSHYTRLGGANDLLASLIGFTEREAEVEERLIADELRRKDERVVAQRVIDAEKRRAQGRTALEEQRLREQQARQMREAMRQLECSPDPHTFSPPVSAVNPTTGEFSNDSLEQAAYRLRPDLYQVSELPAKRRRPVLIIAIAALFGFSALAFGLQAAGPDLDPISYPKVWAALSLPATQATYIGFQMVPRPEPRPDATSASAAGENDAPEQRPAHRRSHRSGAARDRQPEAPARPTIALDVDNIFERGSE